jgi:hypothetical protein
MVVSLVGFHHTQLHPHFLLDSKMFKKFKSLTLRSRPSSIDEAIATTDKSRPLLCTTVGPATMLAVQSQPNLPKPAFKLIIEEHVQPESAKAAEKFNPMKHLDYSPPEDIVRMSDIGYPEDRGVSPIAVSQPFRLFSREAVEQMRAEIFHPNVMEKCAFRSNIAACQLRGYCPK